MEKFKQSSDTIGFTFFKGALKPLCTDGFMGTRPEAKHPDNGEPDLKVTVGMEKRRQL